MSERMPEEDDMDMGGAAGRSMGRLAADLADEVATLTTQLRARDEALRVAREKLEAIEERGYRCSCGNAGPCGCGKAMELMAIDALASVALAAIEEAGRAT